MKLRLSLTVCLQHCHFSCNVTPPHRASWLTLQHLTAPAPTWITCWAWCGEVNVHTLLITLPLVHPLYGLDNKLSHLTSLWAVYMNLVIVEMHFLVCMRHSRWASYLYLSSFPFLFILTRWNGGGSERCEVVDDRWWFLSSSVPLLTLSPNGETPLSLLNCEQYWSHWEKG